MSNIILWVAHVVLSLLMVAFVTAWSSHWDKPNWRKIFPVSIAVIIFITVVPALIVGGFLLWGNMQPKWLFWYGLSESIIYVSGVFIVLKKGLQFIATEKQAATTWSRFWLAISMGVAAFIFLVTLNFAELNILIQVNNVKDMATHKVASLLPSKLPASLDAYPVYEEAALMLGNRKEFPKWFSEINRPDFDAKKLDVQSFLEKQNITLATIRQAISRPGYSAEIDVSDIFNTKIPNFIPYRYFAMLFRLSALNAVAVDRFDWAVQEFKNIEQIGNHLRNLPLIISVMVSFSTDSIYHSTLEYLLAKGIETNHFLIEYPITPHSSVRDSYLKSFRLEAYSNLQFFASTASSYNNPFLFNLNLSPKFNVGGSAFLIKLWRVFLLPSEIRAAKDIIAFNMGMPAETYAGHKKNIESIKKSMDAGDLGFFTKTSVPNYLSYVDRAMICDVQKGLCDLALALTQYKYVNKTYPPKLEDLTPSFIRHIPLDPYDGKPLKMTPVTGGLKLFSIGPDKKEDRLRQGQSIDFYIGNEAFYNNRVKQELKAG